MKKHHIISQSNPYRNKNSSISNLLSHYQQAQKIANQADPGTGETPDDNRTKQGFGPGNLESIEIAQQTAAVSLNEIGSVYSQKLRRPNEKQLDGPKKTNKWTGSGRTSVLRSYGKILTPQELEQSAENASMFLTSDY